MAFEESTSMVITMVKPLSMPCSQSRMTGLRRVAISVPTSTNGKTMTKTLVDGPDRNLLIVVCSHASTMRVGIG